jgi:hypothetical protein
MLPVRRAPTETKNPRFKEIKPLDGEGNVAWMTRACHRSAAWARTGTSSSSAG